MVEDQLVSLGVNLLATGVTAGSGVGASKAKEVLRRRQFSEDLGDVATVFNSSLRDAIAEENTRLDSKELDGVIEDWDRVAAELADLDASEGTAREKDQISVLFESESDAVDRIAEAIAAAKGFDLEATPELRGAMKRAVTCAYREAIVAFEQRIAGTNLQDVFESETKLHLVDRLNDLQTRLGDLHDDVETLLTQTARDEGFVQLTPQYFARTALETPLTCWRTGFNHGEIKAGYHFDRWADDADSSITDVVYERLNDGHDQVVIGPPGSGKTTVCKSVACRWYEDTGGSVLYRESNATRPFESLGALEDCIRSASEPVLVVIEDAATPEACAVFDLLARFEDASSAVFLLNTRYSTWQNPPERVTADARLQTVRSRLATYSLPSISERECERAIATFESVTGSEVHLTPDQLMADLESTEVGEMYLLAYRLASVGSPDRTAEAVTDESTTVMDVAVKRVYDDLLARCDDGDYLPLHLGLLINLLNAAEIGIYPDLLHTLADSTDEHRRIDELVDELEGKLIFEGDSEAYRSHHTLWSSIFFRYFLETEGERRASDHFEQVVNALFETLDDAEKRDSIQRWFRGDADYVRRLDDDSGEMADSLVLTVFNMGDADPQYAFARASGDHRQPIFHAAPLFATTQYSRIELPGGCSEETRLRCINLRGVRYLDAGEFDRAKDEFDHLYERLEATDAITGNRRTEIEAWTLNNLGSVARRRGDLEEAESYHERSLQRFQEVGPETGEAWTLNNLGNVNRLRGNLDEAESFHRRSLELFEELNDTLGQGWTLNNLGLTARIRGDLETAAERHDESLDAFRKIGYQLGEARALNALGLVARERERYDDALDYHRKSLRIAREIGDTQCVAWCYNNLGTVHERTGNLEAAHERYQRSLEVKRDLGDRKGEANTLSNLATVALKRGELEQARSCADESVEILLDIGTYRETLEKLETFIEVCTDSIPDAESAVRGWCETALEVADEHGLEGRTDYFEATLRSLET